MSIELEPVSDPIAWTVVYNDILYQLGTLVSSTGSETDVFPDSDANVIITDWISKETYQFLIETGKLTTDVTSDQDKADAKSAIIYGTCIRVLNRALAMRADRGADFRLGCRAMIDAYRIDRMKIINRMLGVTGLVDYQETTEEWS